MINRHHFADKSSRRCQHVAALGRVAVGDATAKARRNGRRAGECTKRRRSCIRLQAMAAARCWSCRLATDQPRQTRGKSQTCVRPRIRRKPAPATPSIAQCLFSLMIGATDGGSSAATAVKNESLSIIQHEAMDVFAHLNGRFDRIKSSLSRSWSIGRACREPYQHHSGQEIREPIRLIDWAGHRESGCEAVRLCTRKKLMVVVALEQAAWRPTHSYYLFDSS